jgi:hypothetical protein
VNDTKVIAHKPELIEQDTIRGLEIDFVSWDEWALDDYAFADTILESKLGRHFIGMGFDRAYLEQARHYALEEMPTVTMPIPERVGRYERAGPNRRRFKRNARRAKR